MEAAWAGGLDGREVIDEFIDRLPSILREGGSCYLLVIQENGINSIRKKLEELGFKVSNVMKREVLSERQLILRIDNY